MHILCLGINHTTAPLNIREKFAFNEAEARSALSAAGNGLQNVSEAVILSTCNRVEGYAVSSALDFDELEILLAERPGATAQELRAHAYRYSGEAAVDHLYRVTAGLDSLVLGEPQILGQVTRALELALGAGACGAVLSRLFGSAIHAGKRARTETAISRNPASVSTLAASLAAREVKDLPGALVVVVGAGEMAELAVEALRKRGVAHIVVINRTLERAQALAKRWQAQAGTFEQLEDWLLEADILISSTSAPHRILHAARMAEIMPARSQRSMVLIDIAAPRDIDPRVGKLPGIRLFDLDHLEHQVNCLQAEREAEARRVESILAEEEQGFLEFLKTQEMLPLIAELRKQAEAIRQSELERTLRRLPGLTDVERSRIDAMTRALVKKLMETPTQRLRAEAKCQHGSEYAAVARSLFDLSGEPEECVFSRQSCPADSTPITSRKTHPTHSDPIGS